MLLAIYGLRGFQAFSFIFTLRKQLLFRNVKVSINSSYTRFESLDDSRLPHSTSVVTILNDSMEDLLVNLEFWFVTHFFPTYLIAKIPEMHLLKIPALNSVSIITLVIIWSIAVAVMPLLVWVCSCET